MSKLNALLRSRGVLPATSATSATPGSAAADLRVKSSKSSESSRGVPAHSDFHLNLERRIGAMATRWQYSPEELSETLNLARQNPDGWLRAVVLDEHRFGDFDRPLTREEIQEAMRRIEQRQ